LSTVVFINFLNTARKLEALPWCALKFPGFAYKP
jgi:hypothetical protein